MIARYHCEKLDDYVIESLARKLGGSTFFFFSTKRVIYYCMVNGGSSIDARIRYTWIIICCGKKENSTRSRRLQSQSHELIKSYIHVLHFYD